MRKLRWVAYAPPIPNMSKHFCFIRARPLGASKDLAPMARPLATMADAFCGKQYEVLAHSTVREVADSPCDEADLVIITNAVVLTGNSFDLMLEIYGLGRSPSHAVAAVVIMDIRKHPGVAETALAEVWHEALWSK